ncbi:MAG: ComF family protein [Gammaproteobacteria bacterium]
MALAYEFPVAEMVAAMKFARQRCFARVLGEMLSIRLQELADANDLHVPDLILPVPLSRWRLFSRGFNQAELIAADISRQLDVPLDVTSLTRVRHTQPQSGLRRSVRRENLRGAFYANEIILSNKCVAVVDDVITTGSTVTEIVRVLQRCNVQDVQIWSVARA